MTTTPTATNAPTHDCIKRIDAQLAKYNTKLSVAFEIGDTITCTTLVQTEKLNPASRKKPRSLQPTFCPFCGIKDREAS